jgi:hypothetical protein
MKFFLTKRYPTNEEIAKMLNIPNNFGGGNSSKGCGCKGGSVNEKF